MDRTSYILVVTSRIVVYLERKRIGGHSYYYASVKARVDGKPRRARTVYLGTAEEILRVVQQERSGAPSRVTEGSARLKAYPFGTVAALLRTAKELQFVERIDRYAPKRSTPGFTVGQYALLTILARALEPWSKAATGRWFYRKSFLRFLWDAPHRLNSQNLLANLDRLADVAVQKRIEGAFTRTLVERGLRPSQVFWDGTNWSTYVEHGERLPRPGKAKDRRYDLNLVGMAIAMAEDHTPLMHEVVPGNFDESEVFGKMVEALALRLERCHLDPSEMVLVMDKGPNSEANLKRVTDWMHVVGAVPANLVPDLMDLDLDRFSPLHATGRGHPLLAYRARRKLYEVDSTVVVTYNAATARRKGETLARCEARFLAGMAKLKAGYERTKGRQVSYPRAAAIAAGLVPVEFQGVFRYELTPSPKSLTYEVREASKAALLRHFGRRVFFSDLDLDAEDLVRRYEERYKVEEEIRWMKGEERMPLAPLYVRKDRSIVAHAFLVVMGLMLWQLTWKKIRAAGITAPTHEVEEALDELDLVLESHQRRGELKGGRWTIAEHGPLADRLFSALGLAEEIPA
jgi:transposase